MAKEEMYHIALDDYEHGIIIRSLNDEKQIDERGQIYRCGGRPYHQGRNCPKEKVQSYRKGTLL